jgi:predicted nucleic acid-binding protein
MVKIKVYLDNCTYNRPFDDQTQIKIALETEAKRYIQWLIVDNKIDLTYSFVSRFENSRSPHELNKNSINNFFSNASVYVDYTHAASIDKRAFEIMKANIKTRDAYHIACAIEDSCDYFITTDKPLLNYKTPEIVICNTIQFIDFLGEIENE